VGVKRKKDEEAEKDITKQNTRVLVRFRNAYVFDVSQTEGVDLPELREMSGNVGELRRTHRHPARAVEGRLSPTPSITPRAFA